MIIKKADGSLVKFEKFNPHHCPNTGKFTSKGGSGAGGGAGGKKKAEPLTTDQIWNEEYPKAEAKYSAGARAMKEGRRNGDRGQMAWGKEQIRSGVNDLKSLQRRATKQDADDLKSVIDNWNEEINYQYSR